MAFGEFVPLAAVHFLAVVSPGPDFAVTMKSSLAGGRRAGIETAVGIGMGVSIHVFYTLVGIGLLLQNNPMVFRVVTALGAAYLAYLGVKMLCSALSGWRNQVPSTELAIKSSEKTGISATMKRPFVIGFLTNATNPKATLFFVAVFNSLVNPSTPFLQKLGYGIWMCSVSAIWFALVATSFSHPVLRHRYQKFSPWIDAVFGAALLLLGASIAMR